MRDSRDLHVTTLAKILKTDPRKRAVVESKFWELGVTVNADTPIEYMAIEGGARLYRKDGRDVLLWEEQEPPMSRTTLRELFADRPDDIEAVIARGIVSSADEGFLHRFDPARPCHHFRTDDGHVHQFGLLRDTQARDAARRQVVQLLKFWQIDEPELKSMMRW